MQEIHKVCFSLRFGLGASSSPTLFSSLSGSTSSSMTYIHLSFLFFFLCVQSRVVSGNETK